jgi:gamma-glutamyl:cysteine ligase YbdK (ATP-grasp superfamily)
MSQTSPIATDNRQHSFSLWERAGVRERLGLFDAFGVELEYMIVDAETLDVRPACDELFFRVTGDYSGEVEFPDVCWSNELVLHVVELKTAGPAPRLEPLAAAFGRHVERINTELAPLASRLMPTAMHPWMYPAREMRLWPHDCSPIYEAFDRIFDCRGHGWANLQSTHVNLPFANDDEFGRLHAAIRLLLPILPAIAASSPIVEGRLTGLLDNRLEMYRTNARRIASVTGRIVPEPVYTRAEYERTIFAPMYAEIAPYDPDGVLRHEFLNARGAIPRFTRGAIEIRVLDVQECPAADLAIVEAIVAVLRALVDQRWTSYGDQRAADGDVLVDILTGTTRDAEKFSGLSTQYLTHFGIKSGRRISAGDLWRHLVEQVGLRNHLLDAILNRGSLARRIATAAGNSPSPLRLREIYAELSHCLASGTMFHA